MALLGAYHELHWHGAAGSFWCPILSWFRAYCFRDMRKGSETPMVKVLEPTVFHLPSHPWTLLASLLPLALPVSILLSASVDLTLGTLSQWSHIVSLCATGSVYLTQSFSRLPCAVAYGWVAITARTAHVLPYIAYVSISPALPLKLALSREFDHSDRKQDSDAKHLSMCLLTICASVTFGGRYSQFWSCLKSARFYFFF